MCNIDVNNASDLQQIIGENQSKCVNNLTYYIMCQIVSSLAACGCQYKKMAAASLSFRNVCEVLNDYGGFVLNN